MKRLYKKLERKLRLALSTLGEKDWIAIVGKSGYLLYEQDKYNFSIHIHRFYPSNMIPPKPAGSDLTELVLTWNIKREEIYYVHKNFLSIQTMKTILQDYEEEILQSKKG